MRQGLLLAFFALSLLITSCGSDNDKDGNWAKRADYSGAGRGGAVSFTIGEEVYVGLGYSEGDYYASFYKYTNSDMNWGKATTFPGTEAELRRNAVAFSVNGKGYIGLGVNEDNDRLSDFWEFDPIAKTWTKMEGDKMFPGTARQGAVAFSFDKDGDGINDVAYVGTGYGFLDGDDRNYLKDFYKFENGVWSENKTYGGSKTSEATVFVIGTKAYMISGTNNLDNVWEFDAVTEDWTQKKDIDKDEHAENVQRTNAVAFVINGLGYITTGSGTDAREVWEYKPSKDDWKERNDLENEVYSRVDAIGFSIGGKGFIVTGSNGTLGLSDMWEFQPGVKEDDDDND
ncbi:galactose oxidase [Ancylomarina sp. 16SWW S1-10-2]|uniref:Kelch repeat-containing protein n=1 Tax=Ancylomarina sp. 16SWW S1-10-2 TaxID=2499681 RepID=UPI0012AE324D|nr:galactose oxidase [Ancylomarina sp. 16SWW S1-10-2]MRT91349.1 galactose oxidase [Ancylomarina sp. 16SWW S1-10-2]